MSPRETLAWLQDAARNVEASRLCGWLLRPLIDLSPCDAGPLFAAGIDHYWRALDEDGAEEFLLQRALSHGFRWQLASESGDRRVAVADPREVPVAARTPRWRRLCDKLDDWGNLKSRELSRLLLLLHALAFYEPVAGLPVDGHAGGDITDPEVARVLYWHAAAAYMLGMPVRVADYGDADMTRFARLAHCHDVAPGVAFNAAAKLFVHAAKTGARPDELAERAELMEHRLQAAASRESSFDSLIRESRFHRAVAFLPLARGDRAGVLWHMDRAEQVARSARPATAAEDLVARENLHPVLESRAKEAIWLADPELALARACEVVEIDRYDAKSWLELGEILFKLERWNAAAEAYVAAAMLGPPAGAIARHMAGVCYRRTGHEVLAGFFLQGALEIDPLGVSPRAEIARQPSVDALEPLKEWSSRILQRAA